MYVVAPDKTRYVVDAHGTSYKVDSNDEFLLRTLVGSGREPQRVSQEWLETLHEGDPIIFPKVEGHVGTGADVGGGLPAAADKVGMLLKAPNGDRDQYYVVEPGKVVPVSDFTEKLLLSSPDLGSLNQTDALDVRISDFTPDSGEFAADYDWLGRVPVDRQRGGHRTGQPQHRLQRPAGRRQGQGHDDAQHLGGHRLPGPLPTGSTSAYVTPGSGQLYRQFQGEETKAGGVFLVTDTGLRYAMQSNDDSATDDAGIGTTAKDRKQLEQEAELAQISLGYSGVDPAPIPVAWSSFLSTGPRLSTSAARQPQGS
ncbi:type VII secretion protein EccB [Streptomyces kaempferi]